MTEQRGRDGVAALTAETTALVKAEVERLQAERRRFAAAGDVEEDRMLSWADLRAMAALQDLFFGRRFATDGFGLGWAKALLKRAITAVVAKVMKVALARQVELNQRAWNVALAVRRLEDRVVDLERQLRDKP